MTFDPFGDYETDGYLRNVAREKDLAIVKRLEHASFLTGLDEAFAALAKRQQLGYADVLRTHRILFEAVYPWAGQDRTQTAMRLTIRKGKTIFANPPDIRRAIEHALHRGRDKEVMRARPGEIMGYFAFGHPFLDGNGRTIMTVHSIMAQRAGFSIDWPSTDQADYLNALTEELEAPGNGILDNYLGPFVGKAIAYDQLSAQVLGVAGLDGSAQAIEVVGDSAEASVNAEYQAMRKKRGEE
ncbi:MAG: Fic/DOC family protein [Bradyrhizobium sp.]